MERSQAGWGKAGGQNVMPSWYTLLLFKYTVNNTVFTFLNSFYQIVSALHLLPLSNMSSDLNLTSLKTYKFKKKSVKDM